MRLKIIKKKNVKPLQGSSKEEKKNLDTTSLQLTVDMGKRN